MCWLSAQLIGVNEVWDKQRMGPCQKHLFFSVGSTMMPFLVQRARWKSLWNTISNIKTVAQNMSHVMYICVQKKSFADSLRNPHNQLFVVTSLTQKIKWKQGFFFFPMKNLKTNIQEITRHFALQMQSYPKSFLI